MEEQAGTLFPAYLGARCFESAAHLEQWIHTPALQGVLLSTSTGERLEPHQLLEREKVLPSHTTPLRRAAVETSNGVHGQSPSARTSDSPAAQQPARTPLPHAAESFTRWRSTDSVASAASSVVDDTASPHIRAAKELVETSESLVSTWRQCSGLHTVAEWVMNYRKHPAGWPALLMIHGIAEVTGRLRNKVENYAIYSALFLSFSIPMTMDLPDIYQYCDRRDGVDYEYDVDKMTSGGTSSNPYFAHGIGRRLAKKMTAAGGGGGGHSVFTHDQDRSILPCELSRHIFYYTISFGIAAHILTILLAMAFNSALNEAARDADVYRMFARGQGFLATVKVQRTFQLGSLANIVAMVVVGDAYVGWDVAFLWLILFVGVYWVYEPTASRLFKTGSIVNYWRKELGGNPDANDPYDLQVPIACFARRVEAGRLMDEAIMRKQVDAAAMGSSAAAVGGLGDGGGRTSAHTESKAESRPRNQSRWWFKTSQR